MLKYIFFIFSTYAFSQVGGESVYTFLNIPSSARQTALGGKVLTFTDNVNQPIWNPATINPKMHKYLSANYISYLSGISVGSISYAYQFTKKINTFHVNATYLNYGTLIGADENGKETGNFNASDIAFSVGYAYTIPKTFFFVGANLKYIYSSIENYTSSGIAGDIGLMYANPTKPYSITLVARNIGLQITSFNGVREKLPFVLALGGSYQLEKVPLRWYLTIDNLQKWNISVANPSNNTTDLEGNVTQENISFLNNAFRHISIGAELFPERVINLRIGYNFRKSRELQLQNIRSFGGISFGFGLKIKRFKLNYAYSKIHNATNVSTFSLLIKTD